MTGLSTKKQSFFQSFQISDRESCERAIRNGGIAGLTSAALTGILASLGFLITASDKNFAVYLDPWSLVDAVFSLILAMFVFRKSRIASTVLFIYFVAAKIYLLAQGAGLNGGSIVMGVLFLAYFANAMRGTYLWHSSYGIAGPESATPGPGSQS
jgi:hypothetical protein